MHLAFPLLASLCVFMQMVFGNTELEEFTNFIKQFNKVYKNVEEYQYRLSVFTENLNVARRLQREELGTATYGITKFSDLTDEEFARNSLTLVDDVPPNNVKELKVEATAVSSSCDWRKAGIISEAKSQGKCGSCWAFATVGNIEAQWGIIGHSVNLSVQQLIDCGPSENGCKGGKVKDAYLSVIKQKGLVSEKVYPYKAVAQKCKKINSVKTTIKDYVSLPKNEQAMARFVKINGTIAVRINATGLKSYLGGVIHPTSCDEKKLNHAVLAVGYSKDSKVPYWIIKNSWGENWGENGFFRLYFGKNICGVAESPTSSIVTKAGKKKICPRV
ncbi:cathepsin W-like [Phyllobates terribilis]|uniref:cathepsin W-like n=1 Tax=Phyllobates terribilis TaxID=111132 RepID=UPI003CCB1372